MGSGNLRDIDITDAVEPVGEVVLVDINGVFGKPFGSFEFDEAIYGF